MRYFSRATLLSPQVIIITIAANQKERVRLSMRVIDNDNVFSLYANNYLHIKTTVVKYLIHIRSVESRLPQSKNNRAICYLPLNM